VALGYLGRVREGFLFGQTVLVVAYRVYPVVVLEVFLLGDRLDREEGHFRGGWGLVSWLGPDLIPTVHHGH